MGQEGDTTGKERRYWKRWYLMLALWLVILIVFFYGFTQFYK